MKISVTADKRQHRDRKNPGAADKFAKLRHETNAKRGKQIWFSLTIVDKAGVQETGRWLREAL